MKRVFFAVTLVFALALPAVFAEAASLGEAVTFAVEKDFDTSGRTQVAAVLLHLGTNAQFYAEKAWFDAQPPAKQEEIRSYLLALSNEFDQQIYPKLTSVFGSEWRPGVDNDTRVTVLFQSMRSAEGGYFREADEYLKIEVPTSNEREMLYLSLELIDDFPGAKRVLAHELVHLITFNQKNRKGFSEDVWLNEARADYSSTLMGYDDPYSGSNLQSRVTDFIQNPSDSVAEWRNTKYDYASVMLFTQYLVGHYGVNVLVDSLRSPYAGIESINYALEKTRTEDRFEDVFANWAVATAVNDCQLGSRYCYTNASLKNFKLAPAINFLPVTGDVSLSVTNVTRSWSGNWLRFIGGSGDLAFEFSGIAGLHFTMPYIITDSAGTTAVRFLTIGEDGKGSISLAKFGQDYKSLTIIPVLVSQTAPANDPAPTYPFTYTVSLGLAQPIPGDGTPQLIAQLLEQIALLKAEIAKLQAQQGGGQGGTCTISRDIAFGLRNNSDVQCLQEFLADQGSSIYPERLVTGNFGVLTRAAVIRFQEKYASEVLMPLGLSRGTGYVGQKTREKIRQLQLAN